MSGSPTAWPRILAATLAVWGPPAVLRLALARERDVSLLAGGGVGLLADLGVSLAVLALLWGAARLSRILAVLLLLPWLALNLANYESLLALDALASLRDLPFLADQTFLAGSALKPLRPWLSWGVLLGALALGVPGLWGRVGGRRIGAAAAGAAIVLVLVAVLPWNPRVAAWRQTHVLLANLDALTRQSPRAHPAEAYALTRMLRADLEGLPRFPLPGQARNVLLVVLESVSGGYLQPLSGAHGRMANPRMPLLGQIARRELHYSSILAQQVNTNRGLYAILCGDLPRMLPGTPHMSLVRRHRDEQCLPAVLGRSGYRTHYLQAAPLAFMMKDRFMPAIGFQRVEGAESFQRANRRSYWGVDDGAFFDRVMKEVRTLRREEEPWFLTALSVGTHHPYTVPPQVRKPNAAGEFDPPTFEEAVRFLDRRVGIFLRVLERDGVLDDTLVLVTSDESRGPRDDPDPVEQVMGQAWSFLIAMGPDTGTLRVDEPYALSDLQLSVLDYLGRTDAARGLQGRSVFRYYEQGRWLFFGNTRRRANGAITPGGELLLCRRDFGLCERYDGEDTTLFASRRERLAWPAEQGAVVAAAARHSLRGEDEARSRDELMRERRFTLDAREQMLHGGQNLRLRPGEWLEVRVDLEVHGGDGVELEHTLRSLTTVHHEWRERIGDGTSFRLHYSLAPPEGLEKVQALAFARPVGGPSEITFREASIALRRGEPPGPGVQIQRAERY